MQLDCIIGDRDGFQAKFIIHLSHDHVTRDGIHVDSIHVPQDELSTILQPSGFSCTIEWQCSQWSLIPSPVGKVQR